MGPDRHTSTAGSDPSDTARRGVPSEVGATRLQLDQTDGCLRCRANRVPRAQIALGEERSEDWTLRASPGGHLEHADLVGRPETILHRAQNAEFCEPSPSTTARFDHVLDHGTRSGRPWTWRQDDGGAGFFANRISACADARTCVTVPGADSTVSSTWSGSNRSRSTAARAFDSVGRCPRRRSLRQAAPAIGQAQPLGAEPHLRDALRRNIDGAMPGRAIWLWGQQCRLAEAGSHDRRTDRRHEPRR